MAEFRVSGRIHGAELITDQGLDKHWLHGASFSMAPFEVWVWKLHGYQLRTTIPSSHATTTTVTSICTSIRTNTVTNIRIGNRTSICISICINNGVGGGGGGGELGVGAIGCAGAVVVRVQPVPHGNGSVGFNKVKVIHNPCHLTPRL
jgi:hypothetical protein